MNQQLIEHIRDHSKPLAPVETGESKFTAQAHGIKAVVFDVYGTLFISGSGDISLAENEDRSPAIMAALETAGFEILNRGLDWSGLFMQTLQSFREARHAESITYPEVRIVEVWQSLVDDAVASGSLKGSGDLQLAIVDHECRVNPCWPMPNLNLTLEKLSEMRFPLGIVSNAQFYTPLLFPALIGRSHEDYAFRSDFCIWSWVEREGKPSTGLYEKLRKSLLSEGIDSSDVLYVGNDLRNDIWPASELGFKTVLFAGDKRSLRWRREDPDCRHVSPEFIITDLAQLFDILA